MHREVIYDHKEAVKTDMTNEAGQVIRNSDKDQNKTENRKDNSKSGSLGTNVERREFNKHEKNEFDLHPGTFNSSNILCTEIF